MLGNITSGTIFCMKEYRRSRLWSLSKWHENRIEMPILHDCATLRKATYNSRLITFNGSGVQKCSSEMTPMDNLAVIVSAYLQFPKVSTRKCPRRITAALSKTTINPLRPQALSNRPEYGGNLERRCLTLIRVLLTVFKQDQYILASGVWLAESAWWFRHRVRA